jgi:hypothetical protein
MTDDEGKVGASGWTEKQILKKGDKFTTPYTEGVQTYVCASGSVEVKLVKRNKPMANNFNLADAIANIIRYKLDPGDIDSSLTDSEIVAIQHLNAAYGALMADE